MDTDRPIKVLFQSQGQSLLPFIGESRPGVRVTGAQAVELPVAKRTVDCVLRLEQEVGGRIANEWRFEIVRLWEIDVALALRSGAAHT